MKHTLTLGMIGVTRNQIVGFINATPENAKLQVIMGWDGPGNLEEQNPEDLTLDLQAEWEE